MTGTAPDPQDEATFLAAKLDHELPRREAHSRALLDFYTELIRLRRHTPGLRCLSKKQMEVISDTERMTLFIRRGAVDRPVAMLFHLAAERQQLCVPLAAGRWCKLLDSEEPRWMGAGSGVPVEIVSEGTLALTAPPWAFLLWELIV
jgi:maltooligosyltrehalose trehalohydrolase